MRFFSASGKTRSGAVSVGTVGIKVSPRFGVEGGFQFSRPSLSVRVDQDVEEAVQNTLVSVARAMATFERRSRFTTWLYRVVTNACLDELRRREGL